MRLALIATLSLEAANHTPQLTVDASTSIVVWPGAHTKQTCKDVQPGSQHVMTAILHFHVMQKSRTCYSTQAHLVCHP